MPKKPSEREKNAEQKKKEEEKEREGKISFSKNSEEAENSQNIGELWGGEGEVEIMETSDCGATSGNSRTPSESENNCERNSSSLQKGTFSSEVEALAKKGVEKVKQLIDNVGENQLKEEILRNARAGKHNAEIKNCELCGIAFPALRSWTVYCSRGCKDMGFWRKKLIDAGYVVDAKDKEALRRALDE